MYDIMRRGGVPRFRVIERADDAISSFVSETNWAQHYIARGYPLRNKWKEQSRPGEVMTRATVPHKWLWRLAVEDAIEAGFTIVATDKLSGKNLQLDLSAERNWPLADGLITTAFDPLRTFPRKRAVA